MARSNDPKKEGEEREEEEEIWGTWEELLLACAVNRHGTHSWDSVAGELRSRVSSSSSSALTADVCRHRYRHLHRRFSDVPPDHDDDDPAAQIPWLDRLRSLRVAELRQQLHRSDLSIGSLQLKVKRLKEERERSLKPPDKDSCKESNSTEPKPEERIRDPGDPGAAPGSGTGRVVVGGGGETSYNGSSDTIAKGADPSPATDPNPVNESGESVAESKGGEPDGNKESSDVQSSASLTRRRHGGRLRKAVASDSGGGGGAADVPAEEESQPLISVLRMLRSSEYGPIFDRRLESQESESYGRMIRRHVDFEIIQRRIERKRYSCAEFFRDLLLLCNNAIFFFPSSSQESIAAVHLRDLVNKEISTVLRKSSVPSAKEATPPPAQQSPPLPLKPNADRSNTSPHDKKPKPTPTPTPTPATPLPLLVVCRKRSSIAGKPQKKVDKEEEPEKPEPEIVEKEKKEEVKEKEEEVFDKKSTKQRSTVARGLRTNKTRDSSSSGGGGGGGSKLVVVKSPSNVAQPSPPPAKEDAAEPEPDPKPAASAAKKRSAANFLNRMKRSSPLSSNGLLLDMLKNSSSTAAPPANPGKRGGDQKKKSHEDGRKEKEKEKEKASNAVKRSVGRPPKRTAAAPPSKRRREETKNATPPPASSSKKRARR